MSSRNLQFLLRPRSLAIVGASERPGSVGARVMHNVLAGGFSGPVWPVNPKYDSIAGRPVFRSVADLPAAADLAVICTPAPTVPELIEELGARGTRAAVVLSAGLEARRPDGRTLCVAMLEAARPNTLRILGPNCIGLLVPGVALNASFAHAQSLPGRLAFVSQSGALATAVLDWALARGIGFSHFLSLGAAADVDFGDLLDYLGSDPETRAILLYVESISGARKFMSAARAAARNKPVIVVKAGRVPEAAQAAMSHTGALAGVDEVYDAAFRRAGMLRVATTRELFDAAETLGRAFESRGDRVAIVSNGGGPAVMATDALIAGSGRLASLEGRTLDALDAVLPPTWSRGNPVDLIGDAPPERYVAALRAVLADPGVDALLLLHAPTAVASATRIAAAIAPICVQARRPVLTCWMGEGAVREARSICGAAGLPTYATPEEAVGAFLHLLTYRRNQAQLMEVPPSRPHAPVLDTAAVRTIIAEARARGRTVLDEMESLHVLAAYGIPVIETGSARDTDELLERAAELGYPLALKIRSPDITHKSDVGGVALDIRSPVELRTAEQTMRDQCRARAPGARLEGFDLQRMVHSRNAIELIAGIAVDRTFGPVVLFGQGGTAVELIADRAVALPPLNANLARELIGRTRVARLLAGHRGRAAVDCGALEDVLVRLAQLAMDCADIVELDINPLLASAAGVIAIDARIRITPEPDPRSASSRCAIRPYPAELEEEISFGGRTLRLRPIRPEDGLLHRSFLSHIAPEDLRARFFRTLRELPASELARLTQIDYEREMAFLAVFDDGTPEAQILAIGRVHADPDNTAAELALLVRSDLKGQGLGGILLDKLIRYCRDRGLQEIFGEVLAENSRMLHLASSRGLTCEHAQGGTVRIALRLAPQAAP